MNIRLFQSDDYPTVSDWWNGHGWPAVPENMLPKLGVIAEDEGEGIAAAWLYMDNSVGVCWLAWFVGNPDATGKEIIQANRIICQFLEEEALRMDYGVMMTTCRQDSLSKLYQKNGFKRADAGVIHLAKVLVKGRK